MTVSYNLDVSKNSWTTALKVLLRWRGSIWRLVWKELLVWLVFYYILMFIYRSELVLSPDAQRNFEKLAFHIHRRLDWIPLTFLLGFFVSMVVDRWRKIFENMGWIENAAITVAMVVRGTEEDTVWARRTIIRYLCLSQVLVFRDVSMKVRRRFPTLRTIVDAGFLEENELVLFEKQKCGADFNKYWLPINWASSLTFRYRDLNRIKSEPALMAVLNELKLFRTNLMLLCNFDWVPVPLAYPQVVFFAVRVYFVLCLVGRQYIIGEEAEGKAILDIGLPLMTVLQFLFYVGWMKVAESLLNPLGEDDDHFECNVLIDKNIATGLAIVDDTYDDVPPREEKWDRFKTQPDPVYSEETVPKEPMTNAFAGSVAHLVLASKDQQITMVAVKSEPQLEEIFQEHSINPYMSLKRRIRRLSHSGNQRSIRSASIVHDLRKKSNEGAFHKTFNGRIPSDAAFDNSFDSNIASPYSATQFGDSGAFSFSLPTTNTHKNDHIARRTSKLEDVVEEDGMISRDASVIVRDSGHGSDMRIAEEGEVQREETPTVEPIFSLHSPSPPPDDTFHVEEVQEEKIIDDQKNEREKKEKKA